MPYPKHVKDEATLEVLVMNPDFPLPGERLIRVLANLKESRPLPASIRGRQRAEIHPGNARD